MIVKSFLELPTIN